MQSDTLWGTASLLFVPLCSRRPRVWSACTAPPPRLERRRGGARRWAAIGLAEHWRDWRILLAAVLGSRFAMDGLIYALWRWQWSRWPCWAVSIRRMSLMAAHVFEIDFEIDYACEPISNSTGFLRMD
jgi:hypothetical protein